MAAPAMESGPIWDDHASRAKQLARSPSGVSSVVEQMPSKHPVAGSNPAPRSKWISSDVDYVWLDCDDCVEPCVDCECYRKTERSIQPAEAHATPDMIITADAAGIRLG